MRVDQHGIILYVENYAACVAFYRDTLSLKVDYSKDGLTNFHFGSTYLMIEQGGISSKTEKALDKNPTVIRFNVKDLDAAMK